ALYRRLLHSLPTQRSSDRLPRLPRIDRSAARHTLSDPAPPAPPPRGSSLPPGPPNISRPGTALLLASFQFLDALRELADFAQEVGDAGERGRHAQPVAVSDGGRAGHRFAVLEVTRHSALRAHPRAVAQL